MPGPAELLLGVGVPAAGAGFLLLVAWRLAQGSVEDSSRLADWGAAAALGLAVVCGHAALFGAPGFPAATAENWIPWLAVAAVTAATWAAVRGPDPASAVWAPRAALVALTLVLLLRPMMRWTWSWQQSAIWFVALAAALLAWSGLLDLAFGRMPRRSGWAVAAIACGGAAAGLGAGGSLVLAQRGGALAAGAGAGAALVWLAIGRRLSSGASTVLAIALGGFLTVGTFYAELPIGAAVLFALSPVAAAALPVREHRSDLADAALRVVVAAVLVAAGIGWTLAASPPLEPYYG
jgi:hypothetical protein